MAEYRVDELARAAGTTVRNVRVYQDRQLLPAPIRRGRTAIYTDAHLSRLRLIVNMLGRGYAFAQIAEMIEAWESGYSLADLLGLEESLGAPWTQERSTHITLAELATMFGGELAPHNIRRALELNLLERRGARFYAPSPQLLAAGAQLVEMGVPLAEALELADQLQHDIDHITGVLVGLVKKYVLDPKGPGWLPSRRGAALLRRRARPAETAGQLGSERCGGPVGEPGDPGHPRRPAGRDAGAAGHLSLESCQWPL